MSDNKFAQRMAEAGIVPEEFALAVLGGDCKSADKMLREVFPEGIPAETGAPGVSQGGHCRDYVGGRRTGTACRGT